MSDHYYSRTQNVGSDPKYWNFTLKSHAFRFKTDNGVFSKNEIDYGSRLLIDTFVPTDPDGAILDVGCGYGPIGLAVAKSYPNAKIHMVDINERAMALAVENARLNNVNNVQVYQSDRLSSVTERHFSDILTNPPIRAGKNIVHDIFEQSYQHIVPGGSIWVVIQKKQGAPSAIEKLEQLFSEVEVVEKKKGYFILKAKKD